MANERLTLQIDVVTTGEQTTNKLADSLNKVVSIADKSGKSLAAAADSATPAWSKLGRAVKDLAEGRGSYAAIEGGYFLQSLSGGAAIAGGLTTAVLALGAASFSATKSLAELGLQTQALSLKTGLSTREVGQFSFAAKAAGSDVGAFETAMRKLSQGLTEGGEEGKKASEALRTLGVSSRNLDGTLRPMGEIFEGVGSGLAKIGSAAERNTLAVQLFGRSGIELIPTLISLNTNLARAKELGVGLSDAELAKMDRYHSQLTEIGAQWEILKRQFAEGIAGTITLNILQSGLGAINGAASGAWYGPVAATIGGVAGAISPWATQSPNAPVAPGLPLGWNASASGDRITEAFQRSRLGTPEGINARITELESKNSNLSATLQPGSGIGGDAAKSARSEYDKNQRSITGLKESLKALTEEQGKYQKSLDEERKLRESGTPFYILGSGANRTLISSQDIADNLRKTGGRTAPSLYSTDYGSGDLREPPSEAEVTRLRASLNARRNINVSGPDVGSLLSPGTVPGLVYNNAPNELARTVGSEIEKALEEFKSNSLKENSAQISGLRDTTERQARLVGINAGPGSELSVAQQQYSIRQSELATEYSIINAHRDLYDLSTEEYRLTKESQDSTLEYLTSVSELTAKQKEAFSSTVVQGFNAATQRSGRSIAVRDWATGMVRNFADTVVGNSADAIFNSSAGKSFTGGLHSIGNSSTVIGSLLKGTPFSADGHGDPLKTSAAPVLVSAGMDLKLAARELMASARSSSMSASGGGGGMPSGSGIAAAIASGNDSDALPLMNYSGLGTATGQASLLTSTAKAANGFGAGLASFFSGTALSTLFNKGGTASASSQIGAGVGLAGAVAGGAYGIYSGLKQGGVGGDLKAAGSGIGLATGMISNVAKLVGAASPLLSAIPIVGTAIAAVLPLIGGLFNGPQQRATAISNEIQSNTYQAPTALNVTQSSNGTFGDFDAKGNYRTSNFGAVPSVAEPYMWEQTHGFLGGPPSWYQVPGGQTAQFSASKTATAPTTVIIQAMDSQSFNDFAERHNTAIGNAAASALQNVHARFSSEVQRAANG